MEPSGNKPAIAPGNTGLQIRIARPEDGAALSSIYRPYVEGTAITFEYDAPKPEEFEARIRHTLEKYPYLVAEAEGEMVGYAYTGPFVSRSAYDWTAEVSIYLKEDAQHMGLGKRLYQALEQLSKAQGMKTLYACIAYPEKEDKYLTNNSLQFHHHLGYSIVGNFRCCGYKFGQWYHMAWMEKPIRSQSDVPNPVIWFPDLDQKTVDFICNTPGEEKQNG